MHAHVTQPARPVMQRDFEFFSQVEGIAAVARNEQMEIFWANAAFAKLGRQPIADLIGTSFYNHLPEAAADDRVAILRRVFETGESAAYYQFGGDKRVLSQVFPLDVSDFRHAGTFSLISDAPIASDLQIERDLPMLGSPCFNDLSSLTPRELEVLRYIALGMSTNKIATTLFRAAKTVDKHIAAIHRKLGTSSRAELVRYGVERGIQAFSEIEWKKIVDGTTRNRQSKQPSIPAEREAC